MGIGVHQQASAKALKEKGNDDDNIRVDDVPRRVAVLRGQGDVDDDGVVAVVVVVWDTVHGVEPYPLEQGSVSHSIALKEAEQQQ